MLSSCQSLGADPELSAPIGIAKLAKLAFDGLSLSPIWALLVDRVNQNPDDAAAFLDLSTIAHIQGRRRESHILQTRALELCRIYRYPPTIPAPNPIRLLVLKAAGDFMANLPIEFLLDNSAVTADIVYALPGRPLPNPIPDHDVTLVAVAESDDNQALLREMAVSLRHWRRPIINRPERISRLSRDGTWDLLNGAPGVEMPRNVRIDRSELLNVAGNHGGFEGAFAGIGFPIVIRPVASHAGDGLQKFERAPELDGYLKSRLEREFFIAPYVNYRGNDGRFRKYRVVIIDGKPFACHMAVSDHWMVHYLNADMRIHADRRSEEEQFMLRFDKEFAIKHGAALAAIAERCGLDYLPLDCGETQDGRLLIFESGTNMIVHSMDPEELFPYKPAHIRKLYTAFEAMLRRSAKQVQAA